MVVSAMGKNTDLLVSLAAEITDRLNKVVNVIVEHQHMVDQSGSRTIYAFLIGLPLAMLTAIYLAIRSAQLLTRPVHDLSQGPRATGKRSESKGSLNKLRAPTAIAPKVSP